MVNEKLIEAFNTVHNIRSPLSIVLSRVNSVLAMLPPDSEQYAKLAKTLTSIDRMNEQITAAMGILKENMTEEDLAHLM
ncbi:MAG: hypothetical protein MJY74_04480 [Bacteroidaceae bacterium]|nr:hypothetical protein [Bacteroidaceae bacterium]